MAERKAYPEFQKLLRQGIGTRTQKDFAEETGITKESINRMLNNDVIPQPSKTTLQKIASHVSSVSYNEFLVSCGYEMVSIEQDIKDTESALIDAINELKNSVYKSISDFLESVYMLYMSNGLFSRITKKREVEDVSSPADYFVQSSFTWDFDDSQCFLEFTLEFVETKKENVIITGIKLDDPKDSFIIRNDKGKVIGNAIVIKKLKHSAYVSGAKPYDFVSCLIGGDTYISETIIGFGFYLSGTPDNFKEFLLSHASSYCKSKAKKEIFNKIINSDDLQELFDDLEDDEGTPISAGDIVADILSSETGKEFEYYVGGFPENHSSNAVMIECKNCKEANEQSLGVVNAVYSIAKELNIPEFGTCYHQREELKTGKEYITKDFHIEF